MTAPKPTFEKVFDWFTTLTWPKYVLSTIAAATVITMVTLYENRQQVFEHRTPGVTEDFELKQPSKDGVAIFENFLKAHPYVAYISLIDANPITNRRTVVARFYNDEQIKVMIESELADNPTAGDGSLFMNDPILNKQVLSILAGEFHCDPAKVGVIAKAFPEVAKRLKYSCRLPLPPAFGKATGWITLHLDKWPLDNLDSFKVDALTLSLLYYETDITKKKTWIVK
jgi:hypothetical protein